MPNDEPLNPAAWPNHPHLSMSYAKFSSSSTFTAQCDTFTHYRAGEQVAVRFNGGVSDTGMDLHGRVVIGAYDEN